MHPEIIEEICEKVYRKFPEVSGIKPKVRKQPVPKDAPKAAPNVKPKMAINKNILIAFPILLKRFG